MKFENIKFMNIKGNEYDCEYNKEENTLFIKTNNEIKKIQDIPVFIKETDFESFNNFHYKNINSISDNNNENEKHDSLGRIIPKNYSSFMFTKSTFKYFEDIFEKNNNINPYLIPFELTIDYNIYSLKPITIKVLLSNNNSNNLAKPDNECPIKFYCKLVY